MANRFIEGEYLNDLNGEGDMVHCDEKIFRPKVLGYYVYNRKVLQARDIDPFLCTHIVFAYAKVENGELTMSNGEDVKPYRQLAALKEINHDLKTLLSVQEGLFEFISYPNRNFSGFFKQAIAFLKEYDFDGIELSVNNPKMVEKKWLASFLSEFHEALKQEVKYTNRAKTLLAVALPSTRTQLMAYDFDVLRKVVDFATAITYDLNTSPKKTSYHSPLHPAPGENKFFSVSGLIDFLIELGLPASKLLWGLPTYGRSYHLYSVNQHGFKARTDDVGDPGPILRMKGILSYEEIGMSLRNGATRVYDDKCCVPYMFDGKLWVTYEDTESATEKTLFFKNKLGGVAIWNLNLGDPRGKNNGDQFPIVKAVKKVISLDN